MRRALLATAGTVAALVAILDYKSAGTSRSVPAAVSSAPASSTSPSTTAPSSTSTTTPSSRASAGTGRAPASYAGSAVDYRYGEIEVQVTVEAGKITAVGVPVNEAVDARSEAINSESVPVLVREVLAAQGVHIDVVSGATYTSDAFAESLQAAVAKVPE